MTFDLTVWYLQNPIIRTKPLDKITWQMIKFDRQIVLYYVWMIWQFYKIITTVLYARWFDSWPIWLNVKWFDRWDNLIAWCVRCFDKSEKWTTAWLNNLTEGENSIVLRIRRFYRLKQIWSLSDQIFLIVWHVSDDLMVFFQNNLMILRVRWD